MIELPEPWPSNPWTTRFRTVRASDPAHLAPGLRIVTVQSPALGGRGELSIHLTEGSDAVPGIPIVIMLHGVYGSFWNWTLAGGAHLTLDRLVREGRVRPMVLVTPSDGLRGEGTAYLPHPDADYERWIMEDVVDCVRELESASRSRRPSTAVSDGDHERRELAAASPRAGPCPARRRPGTRGRRR